MPENKPTLYIIAGPNGAGKTTFADGVLPSCTKSREFVNADIIAQRLSPRSPEAVAFRAGREMLERIKALGEQKVDFSIETTLSGKTYVSWLRELKAKGYTIHLFFIWLPDVQMSIRRVADRVRKGGHNIPEATIRRRYLSGIRNLFEVYRPLVDSWTLFDNSRPTFYTIAREEDRELTVLDDVMFQKFMSIQNKSTGEELHDTFKPVEWIQVVSAMRIAIRGVIAEHCKTGHPLITWRDGKLYLQPPEEAKRELEEVLKNDPCAAMWGQAHAEGSPA